jgi:hypothetical protein
LSFEETLQESVHRLQYEIARIREENRSYLHKPGHTSQEHAQHRDRELRLKQILSELASLSKKKLP